LLSFIFFIFVALSKRGGGHGEDEGGKEGGRKEGRKEVKEKEK